MRRAQFWLRSLGGVGTLGAALLLGLGFHPPKNVSGDVEVGK